MDVGQKNAYSPHPHSGKPFPCMSCEYASITESLNRPPCNLNGIGVAKATPNDVKKSTVQLSL